MNEEQVEKVVADDERYVQVSKGVLVAKDRTALREYQRYAQRKKQKQNRINKLEEDVQNLKSDITEMKSSVDQILSLLTKDSE